MLKTGISSCAHCFQFEPNQVGKRFNCEPARNAKDKVTGIRKEHAALMQKNTWNDNIMPTV